MPATRKASSPRKRASSKRSPGTKAKDETVSSGTLDLKKVETDLAQRTAEERIAWGLETFQKKIILSSSFGAQSAVTLHLVTSQRPEIPVVLVDTGYLFPETYGFIDSLSERLDLNLTVFHPQQSAAWQEARHGKLWEQGLEGLEKYNRINKTEPFQRALRDLGARAWIAGIRKDQSSSREGISPLALKDGVVKLHPIFDWTDKDIYQYLQKHDLPYHPLWEAGYISIGDWHTSHKLSEVLSKDDVRFNGLKRECGLHEDTESVTNDYVI